MRIGVIIPALNEEGSIGQVIEGCLLVCKDMDQMRVMVCDNGSTDRTAEASERQGAWVVREPTRGYGAACLAAIQALGDWPDVYVFIDADGSSCPDEMHRLLESIREGQADLVIGRRICKPGSTTLLQRFGNGLATELIWMIWRTRFHDLCPYRAIRKTVYESLGMSDKTWGWTIEMQIKAILHQIRFQEVDVTWCPRIAGESKISGSLPGAIKAGAKIFWTIGRHLSKRSLSLRLTR
jgi:glycosyltransferase involved in cell wall biosynthesis